MLIFNTLQSHLAHLQDNVCKILGVASFGKFIVFMFSFKLICSHSPPCLGLLERLRPHSSAMQLPAEQTGGLGLLQKGLKMDNLWVKLKYVENC